MSSNTQMYNMYIKICSWNTLTKLCMGTYIIVVVNYFLCNFLNQWVWLFFISSSFGGCVVRFEPSNMQYVSSWSQNEMKQTPYSSLTKTPSLLGAVELAYTSTDCLGNFPPVFHVSRKKFESWKCMRETESVWDVCWQNTLFCVHEKIWEYRDRQAELRGDCGRVECTF